MRILCIGDVVGSAGCQFLRSKLPALKRFHGVDLVICNGENSADGNGITPQSAQYLFDSGVDALTLGNHTFRRREDPECFGRRIDAGAVKLASTIFLMYITLSGRSL